MKQFREMKLTTAAKKAGWTSIYHFNKIGRATPTTFEELGQIIGQLLDETQLERAEDHNYIKIELWQHNDRVISGRVKCSNYA
jgi:hypothetical protein